MKYTRIIVVALLLFIAHGAMASITKVSSLEQITTALKNGERNIQLQDGEYPNFQLDITWSGTEQSPLVIEAEHPGGVRITGNSKVVISGNYIVFSGIQFTNGKREKDGALIHLSGDHNRITQTKFTNYNQVTGVWIQLNGRYNRVDHCWFEGKKSGASYINVDVPKKGGNHHLVDYNYFSRPPLGRNGGSAMRIGHGSMAQRYCYTTVEYNLFDDCSGEGEIMSSKSCGNTFRYNTFLNCKGGLSLRQGVEGIIESNFFISNKGDKNRCSGISVRGRDHLVINNYFYGLAPKKGGILSFGSGSKVDPKRLALGLIGAHFPKTANNTVAHNLFVSNNAISIDVVNDLGHRNKVYPPDSLYFFGNVLTGIKPLIKKHTRPQHLIWEGNIYQGSLGISETTGLASTRLKLNKREEMIFTPIIKSTNKTHTQWSNYISKGILKRLDFQLPAEGSNAGVHFAREGKRGGLQHPYSKDEVGPQWISTPVVSHNSTTNSQHPRLFFQKKELSTMAKQRQTTHKEEWNSLLSMCAKLQKMEPIAKPKSKLVFAFPEKLAAVALVQSLDPTQPYQKTFEKHFWEIMNWKEWDLWIQGKGKGPANDLGIAQALIALTACYDWQYANFDSREREFINNKLITIANHFFKDYSRFRTKSLAIMNCNHGTNVYAALSAVLYGTDNIPSSIKKEWTKSLDHKYNTLTREMNTNMSDGYSDEGATYFMFQLKTYMQWMEARRNGLALAYGKPYQNLRWFKNASAYCLYSILPGGTDNFGGLARYGDANPKFWGNPYSVFPALAKNLKDPIAQWLSQDLDIKEVELWRSEKKEMKDQNQKSNFDVWRYIWKGEPLSALDITTLPNWHFFEDAGMFVWRSSWKNDATYFTIKSGQHYQGHGHPDDGQFMLHRAGIPYIIDMGYSNPKYTNEHNVLLINGKGQVGDGDVWCDFGEYPKNRAIWGKTEMIVNTGNQKDSDYFNLICDPTNMYPVKELKSWKREIIGWNGLFLLRDKIDASEKVNMELLIHSYASRKGKKDAYEYSKDRKVNPFTSTGQEKNRDKQWIIDPRNGKAPLLLVKDLSSSKWNSKIDEAWFYDNYLRKKDGSGHVQLGSVLKRNQMAQNSTSLLFLGFQDKLKGMTISRLKKGDGVQILDKDGKVIKEVAWKGKYKTQRLQFKGEMAGIEYSSSNVKSWFGRQITQLKDKNATIFSANKEVSVHASVEQNHVSMHFSLKQDTHLQISASTRPKTIICNGRNLKFTYRDGIVSLLLKKGESCNLNIRF